ncbi:Scr1 family TA system antitoxin-like transcriptional regulator [Nocardia sp. NBC_01730]|uniref:Scr1 family TA system antitoxin-like transcriptional regulator n=1 Tax=Nocardia sp. NBC_01730 TaxID=2975998 RepID=UPI003FA396C4
MLHEKHAAISLHTVSTAWKVTILPGLLQTPTYRCALAWSEIPKLSPEAVEGRIELATRRQARLEDPELTVDVLLHESALNGFVRPGPRPSDRA